MKMSMSQLNCNASLGKYVFTREMKTSCRLTAQFTFKSLYFLMPPYPISVLFGFNSANCDRMNGVHNVVH